MSENNCPPWFDHYNPVKLLSKKDIEGKTPAIYISSGNRTGGKTTAFNGMLLNRYIKHREKFGLIYRYAKDSTDVVERFFKDIGRMWFTDGVMTSKIQPYGCEIFYNGKSCGYGLPLNLSDDIKKRSHLLTDIEKCLFDEFQSETGAYLDNELTRFQTIMFSLSRGCGKMYRYVPCILISNQVSALNPYYEALGVLPRLCTGGHYIKGHGWVLEVYINPDAKKAIETSPLAKAFSKSEYAGYAANGDYLNDNKKNVKKITTAEKKYLYTLKYNGHNYSVNLINDILYIGDTSDKTRKSKYSCCMSDVCDEFPLISENAKKFICNKAMRGKIVYNSLKSQEAIERILKQ